MKISKKITEFFVMEKNNIFLSKISEANFRKNHKDPLGSFVPYGESKLANMFHMRHLAVVKLRGK